MTAKTNAHRLRVPGDVYCTERVHVNYSAHRFGLIGGRRVTHMALQRKLGLLPERRPGSGGGHRAYSGADGSSLA